MTRWLFTILIPSSMILLGMFLDNRGFNRIDSRLDRIDSFLDGIDSVLARMEGDLRRNKPWAK